MHACKRNARYVQRQHTQATSFIKVQAVRDRLFFYTLTAAAGRLPFPVKTGRLPAGEARSSRHAGTQTQCGCCSHPSCGMRGRGLKDLAPRAALLLLLLLLELLGQPRLLLFPQLLGLFQVHCRHGPTAAGGVQGTYAYVTARRLVLDCAAAFFGGCFARRQLVSGLVHAGVKWPRDAARLLGELVPRGDSGDAFFD
jgi:hypothetical protein